jgi:hypothetical protein
VWFYRNNRPRRPVAERLKKRAGEGIRTPDSLITNQVLYQLSYAGWSHCKKYQKAAIRSSFPFPLDPLRGVLQDDTSSRQIIPNLVGQRKILALAGFDPLTDELFDLGIKR